MKQKLFLLIGCLLTSFFFACESDTPTTNTPSLAKKLELNPKRLDGEQYIEYELKAKVTNVPLSDVDFHWDFDEGDGFASGSHTMTVSFKEIKVHFVRVKAFDHFADTLLGYDSIQVDIRPQGAFVRLMSDTNEIVTLTDDNGVPNGNFKFTVEASSPPELVNLEWDFGDGGVFTDTSGKGTLTYKYMRGGEFRVVVRAVEKSGYYLGSDTIHVTMRLKTPSMEDLKRAHTVLVFLVIDSTHSVFTHPMFKNPFALGLRTHHDTAEGFDTRFGANDLFMAFRYGTTLRDTIRAAFSPDLSRVEQVTVRVNDSMHYKTGGSAIAGILNYGYTAKDLELFAVNSQRVEYRTTSSKLSDFLSGLFFDATGHENHACGIYNIAHRFTLPQGVKAIVQFLF